MLSILKHSRLHHNGHLFTITPVVAKDDASGLIIAFLEKDLRIRIGELIHILLRSPVIDHALRSQSLDSTDFDPQKDGIWAIPLKHDRIELYLLIGDERGFVVRIKEPGVTTFNGDAELWIASTCGFDAPNTCPGADWVPPQKIRHEHDPTAGLVDSPIDLTWAEGDEQRISINLDPALDVSVCITKAGRKTYHHRDRYEVTATIEACHFT